MNILKNAVIYDCETFPNVFTLSVECLVEDFSETWEISEFKDEREGLFECFKWLMKNQVLMIGFNNLGFDYPVIDFLLRNKNATPTQIYTKADTIINSFNDRFSNNIWPSDRFAPQLDLFKLHHMDNHAKSTSLKALQINMRSPSVVDMPVAVGTMLTKQQIRELLIPYNRHDVAQTKQFAKLSAEAINFRMSLTQQFGVDVLNWSDTKIGSKIMEKRLGKTNKTVTKVKRESIALKDIIFPYIHFEHPEFKRILDYFREQVLTSEAIKEIGKESGIKTKGIFKNVTANVGGLDFHFGTGGIHGSVSAQRIRATESLLIRDIDVEGLYPSIAIVNGLSPEHLGKQFSEEYAKLPQERKYWQKLKGKKCVEANTLKLASNGVYGNSNNPYSVFYDPQFTLTITVNGQLMLCMLAEKLLTVPSLQIQQINTDGITYTIHPDHEPTAATVCREWETYTKLKLESQSFTRLFIRDCNSYVAEYEE